MIRSLIAVALVVLTASAALAQGEPLRVAVTTSFHNSGLAEVILPEAERDLGFTIDLLVVGTGQALRLGRAGDVDAVLVHSRAAEDEFVAEGFAPHRREIMYNDFVIVGPSSDPAGIANAEGGTAALARIAEAKMPFASRGDDSGTHRRELALWRDAGVDTEAAGDWYRAAGAGMGATLNVAAGMDAYVLTDRASWLHFANKRDLKLLYEGDPTLFNQYAYLPVSAQKHPHVAAEAAAKLEDWLTSQKGQAIIGDYTIEGERLFVPNATPSGAGPDAG